MSTGTKGGVGRRNHYIASKNLIVNKHNMIESMILACLNISVVTLPLSGGKPKRLSTALSPHLLYVLWSAWNLARAPLCIAPKYDLLRDHTWMFLDGRECMECFAIDSLWNSFLICFWISFKLKKSTSPSQRESEFRGSLSFTNILYWKGRSGIKEK